MSKTWNKVKNELMTSQQIAYLVGISNRRVQQLAEDAIKAGVAVKVGKVTVWHKIAIKWFDG